ncbi:MAG: PA2779 family protein [Sulfuricella sp.]|nr:PA2779 family protein [Sulfuricella sp.]
MIRTLKHLFIYFLITSFTFIGLTQSARAALVGTEQAVSSSAQDSRANINAALDRPEVRGKLEALGISKADAQARVAALTDEEATSLNSKINSLPAGGDGILGALLLIFLVLLVTDILGLTKVFPFTRAR